MRPIIQQKRLLAGALGCVLACTCPAGYAAAAGAVLGKQESQAVDKLLQETGRQHNSMAELPESPEDLQPDYNDPDYVKRLFQQQKEDKEQAAPAPFSIKSNSAKTTVSPFTGLVYTHAEQQDGYNIANGIDVSMWQAKIDWQKVKAAGVKFVFIRCGYTSLSSSFLMHEDPYFTQNIQGAYDAGIKVGIYFFSNSITTSEAKQEANKTLELINAYKHMITLPVVYDFEAFSNAYRAYGLPKSQVTKNALTYLKIIGDAGYTPMYYSSPSFIESSFQVSELKDYNLWLAHYTTKSYYTGDYTFWQYSSTGQINGISGNVDCNFQYTRSTEEPEIVEGLGPVTGLEMKSNTSSTITIQWEPVEEAAGYKVYQSEALGGTYRELRTINDNLATEYTDTAVTKSEGRQYYYKIVPYIVEDGEMKYGEESDILTANTKRYYKHRLKITANVNLRKQAGTEYAPMVVVPSGTALNFYKFTMSSTGKKWYKVTYTHQDKSYTGYLSSAYVKTYTYGTAAKNVNARSGPGLSYKIKRVIPEGIKLTIKASSQDVSGTKWSQVSYKQNGKSYGGYIPTKYINRI